MWRSFALLIGLGSSLLGPHARAGCGFDELFAIVERMGAHAALKKLPGSVEEIRANAKVQNLPRNFDGKAVSLRSRSILKTKNGETFLEVEVVGQKSGRRSAFSAHNGRDTLRGNVEWNFEVFGDQLMARLGFYRDGSRYLIPDAQTANRRLDLLNKALKAEDRTLMRFYPSEDLVGDLAYIDGFRNYRLPRAAKQDVAFHDHTFHFGSILLPKAVFDHAVAQVDLAMRFRDFLLVKGPAVLDRQFVLNVDDGLNIPVRSLRKKIESTVLAIGEKVDGITALPTHALAKSDRSAVLSAYGIDGIDPARTANIEMRNNMHAGASPVEYVKSVFGLDRLGDDFETKLFEEFLKGQPDAARAARRLDYNFDQFADDVRQRRDRLVRVVSGRVP